MKINDKMRTKILCISLIVICLSGIVYSGGRLFFVGKEYMDGRSEYDRISKDAIKNVDKEEQTIDFEHLLQVNGDTVGWIKFPKEPSQINYPIVQCEDNSTYLHQTFYGEANPVGTIFIDCNNRSDFGDGNTIVYGHRMKDGSMFRELQSYREKSFWKENQYFYIYTLDGRKIKYHIYAAGRTSSKSEAYKIKFSSEKEFKKFVDYTKKISDYDTDVDIKYNRQIVTLSTCTSENDEHRIVVFGVKEEEKQIQESVLNSKE